MKTKPKYQQIKVTLTEKHTGKIFAVISTVLIAMRLSGIGNRERRMFADEALERCDYRSVVAVCRRWVTVTEKRGFK